MGDGSLAGAVPKAGVHFEPPPAFRFRLRQECTFAAHDASMYRTTAASALVDPPPPWLLDGQGGCVRACVARGKCRTMYCIASSKCSLEAFFLVFLKRRHVFALPGTGYATGGIESRASLPRPQWREIFEALL